MGRPLEHRVWVEDTPIPVGAHMKYLGLTLDGRWSFREHFSRLAPRLGRVVASLSRLLPNLGGPDGRVRKIFAGTVQAVVLYGVPVFAGSMMADWRFRQIIRQPQHRMAIRVARGNRTVSGVAAGILAALPPLELQAKAYADMYAQER
ncbi:uncharacterized protein LOC115238438 [Formica exsecta]|uniref:uncharacterized protein LOC115238438 n=1 Tax=Formica exsecta TaxID=72781 RepID=UPI00114148C5|nr:uncharacterized protein LOC115238438 [Formica exsecta]